MLKKAMLSLTIGFSFCILLAGCASFNDDTPREKIMEYVKENHQILESIMEEGIPNDDAEREAWIQDALGKKTIVKNVSDHYDGIIDFYCGGTGLSTNSTYSGFYFSADNTPFAFEFPADQLKETSSGVYEWKSNTGKEIITERILPNWFYYCMMWN